MLGDLQNSKFPRAASAMEALADHYGIPSVHMGLEVARLEKAGKVVFKAPEPKTDAEKAALAGKILFSSDGVHPHPEGGHQLYLEAVVRSMQKIKGVGLPGPHALKSPFVADNWEKAKMLPLDIAKLSGGWQKLDPATHDMAKRFANRMPCLWKVNKPGETLSFRFKGTYVGIYDLLGPDCGQVIVKLDDRPPAVRPRIDAYCTYHRLATLTLATDLPDAVHTVAIEMDSARPDKRKILFEHNRPDFDQNPKKYDDLAWYAGALMLIGDVVE